MIRVVAGIIQRDARVLICQRRAGKALGLKWEFPGGKMRPSETPSQALERELREELGVAAKIGNVVDAVRHRYSEMPDTVQVVFMRAALCEPLFSAMQHGEAGGAFERIVWAPRAELRRYDFLAADRRMIARLVGGG
jgi:8-oxo-dGTP diphosphatase